MQNTSPPFWKWAAPPAPPPPPPPPSQLIIPFFFDFENVSVEAMEEVTPHSQYSSTNFSGYTVVWTGDMVAKSGENLAQSEEYWRRAVLGPTATGLTQASVEFIPGPTAPPLTSAIAVRWTFMYFGPAKSRFWATNGTNTITQGLLFDPPLWPDSPYAFADSGWWDLPPGYRPLRLEFFPAAFNELYLVDDVQVEIKFVV